uniref:Uncharacterized protein n=1 Tax=Panagrolaimus sp. PS1159 TaxID=55785 RepID=A0AC35GBH0_9BILA
MSKNNLNDNSIDYPEMLQNSIPSSSYTTEANNTIGKSDEERSLRPPPPLLPLAPPVSLTANNNSIDTHIVAAAAAAAASPTTETTASKETENVSDSPRKEFFLDSSFGPTPSSYYFYSDNYQNFDEELYTFEEFLGAPDTPKEEGEKSNSKVGEFDSIPLDSPRAGPSVERNPITLKIRERSYTPDIGNF